MSVWTDVDEPVLRWLAEQPPSFIPDVWQWQLELRPEPTPNEVGNLDSVQVDEALTRLYDHGLVDGRRTETISYARWSRLRLTGHGLLILGEWPDLDRLASAAGLRLLLTRLAEEAPDADERGNLRQLVGFLSQLGEDVVTETLTEVGGGAGEELTS